MVSGHLFFGIKKPNIAEVIHLIDPVGRSRWSRAGGWGHSSAVRLQGASWCPKNKHTFHPPAVYRLAIAFCVFLIAQNRHCKILSGRLLSLTLSDPDGKKSNFW